MKEIAVVSGKGGTGKTSVTAVLARLLNNPVVADCDVDAANLHLLLSPHIEETHDFVSGRLGVIKAGDCANCGLCEESCRFGAVKKSGEVRKINPLFCEGCGVCAEICPSGAIEFAPNHCGKWFESRYTQGAMVHAHLSPGSENSGKLVAAVRQAARQTALQIDAEWILADGPPGIGCPVISAITGCHGVIIVTEPTLPGKHDLVRILGLVEHFGIAPSVVINKWDLHPGIAREISEISAQAGVPILMMIPYCREFKEALNKGHTIWDHNPEGELSELFLTLRDKLVEKYQ